MSKELRWRVLILQAIVAAVFAVGALIAFKEARFTRDYVHDQLAAQKISFPQAGAANFKPEDYPELQQYAGQKVDDGEKAQAYANGYIGRHLTTTAEGRTYSEQSTYARQNPGDAKAQDAVQTLFRGETLRGMLLNAWGWWTIGTYTFYAGFALALATVGVLGAFAFELVMTPRRRHAASRVAVQGTLTTR